MTLRATEQLRNGSEPHWTAATQHRFTNALADGSLDAMRMGQYLQQDYLFIEGFVRLLSTAISSGPSLADVVPSARFLGVICGAENTYFQRSFAELGISENPDHIAPETKAFQNIMERARTSGQYHNMLAVLVVAEWVYLSWAAPVEHRAKELPFWLGEWITLHAGDGFEAVVEHFRTQLDVVWPNLSATEQAEATQYFNDTVKLEQAFFDAAWGGFLTGPAA